MNESILNSIKQLLGVDPSYDVYDGDIMIHINTAFARLHSLGVGPKKAFFIEDESASWNDFMPEDTLFHNVKTFIHLKVKIVFDPPLSSAVLEVMKEQIKELEFLLNVAAETPEEEIQNGE